MSPSRVIALTLMAFGLVLHTFTWAVKSTHFSVGFWLLSLSPYIAASCLYFWARKPHAAAGALVLPGLFDAGNYYSVFVDPTSSTSALGMVFVPILNIAVFVPTGTAVGWWVGRRIAMTNDMPSNKSLERTREG
jgi:hypothetical protein